MCWAKAILNKEFKLHRDESQCNLYYITCLKLILGFTLDYTDVKNK